ncbi:L-rhamnose mutarotase [Commensalibacter oyaizuii]|uniref:L-rhamnose mutarotase n=1 Tax=Commensalibacter oyaizuii TaxID=3043873 RepID=A0ABT6Q3T2_9PROT|nr:L-rhamnose mutarotase [Commensalibacter sp. TBRC 16381]MDI2091169.1 L-rhamnose mutarotase [Commensalibacter sp. TBRC 16381]
MGVITRYCQALDLVDDPAFITEYEAMHKKIWPEVAQHIRESGVIDMQIWRIGNRLFMIMDVNSQFSFARSEQMAADNPILTQWEEQMWKYQLPTPWTPRGQKWVPMQKIFDLNTQ